MVTEQKFGVAVKAVIQNPDNKILLIKKSGSEEVNPDTWDIPGGRINFGENLYTALWREVKEETGLDIEIIRPSNVWAMIKRNLHLVGISFYCKTDQTKIVLSDEHVKYNWSTPDTILKSNVPKWIKDEIKAVQTKVSIDHEMLYKKYNL
jgi:8-oxo-dGTP diphosphatase